jgi:limonene-1,2-epoxide hydrolase
VSEREELSCDIVRELWSKTYNAEGHPDWSHLFPYYHPDILFRDSIQEIRGLEEFRAMCGRMAARSRSLRMKILSVVREGGVIFLEWEMILAFGKYPDSSVYGCTRLTLHEDGRIIEQRDYYDLWGDIFDNIPRFGSAYRRFMRRKFG